MKCEYCHKAGFKKLKNLYGHQAKCAKYIDYISKYRNNILTKKYLNLNITKLNRPCYQLELELNDPQIKTKHIIARCKELGIKTQSLKEAANNSKTKEKREEFNLKKYGYKNNFQSKTTKKTLQRKYGKNITNVFQLDQVKQKSKKTLQDRYGITNPVNHPNFRRNVGNISWQHKSIETILDKYNIKYDSENKNGIDFTKYNKTLKRIYNPRPDIILHDFKIIIEIYGDYYHANPKKYKPNDILVTWAGEIKAKDIWSKDKARVRHLQSFGYKVYCIWGSEIRGNRNKVEKKLCKLLKLKVSQE